jgi:hypothetical protein
MEIQSGAVSPTGAIQEGWDIIKDDYWTFFGMTTVFIILIIVVAMVVGLINNGITLGVSAALGVVNDGSRAANVSSAVVPQLVSMAISFFTNIIVAAVTGVLMCGLMNGLSRKVQTGSFEFGDLFSGFDKFMPCLIYAAILSFIQFVIAILMLLIGVAFGVSISAESLLKDGKFDPSMLSGLIGIVVVVGAIFMLLNIILAVCTVFVYPLIAEKNLSGIEALSTSTRGALSNLLGLIGFFILQILISMAGILACLIGVLFVVPILYSGLFAAYRSVFGGPTVTMYQQPPPPPIFNNQPGY